MRDRNASIRRRWGPRDASRTERHEASRHVRPLVAVVEVRVVEAKKTLRHLRRTRSPGSTPVLGAETRVSLLTRCSRASGLRSSTLAPCLFPSRAGDGKGRRRLCESVSRRSSSSEGVSPFRRPSSPGMTSASTSLPSEARAHQWRRHPGRDALPGRPDSAALRCGLAPQRLGQEAWLRGEVDRPLGMVLEPVEDVVGVVRRLVVAHEVVAATSGVSAADALEELDEHLAARSWSGKAERIPAPNIQGSHPRERSMPDVPDHGKPSLAPGDRFWRHGGRQTTRSQRTPACPPRRGAVGGWSYRHR